MEFAIIRRKGVYFPGLGVRVVSPYFDVRGGDVYTVSSDGELPPNVYSIFKTIEVKIRAPIEAKELLDERGSDLVVEETNDKSSIFLSVTDAVFDHIPILRIAPDKTGIVDPREIEHEYDEDEGVFCVIKVGGYHIMISFEFVAKEEIKYGG